MTKTKTKTKAKTMTKAKSKAKTKAKSKASSKVKAKGVFPLNNLSSAHATVVPDDHSGWRVYHVTKVSTLLQAAGYLKYIRASSGKAVYFRGQHVLYSELRPSLFRSKSSSEPVSPVRRSERMNQYLAGIRSNGAVLQAVPEASREAVLQHYGVRTRWLDVVDNIWVALWFACHRVRTTGEHGEYLHFERRDPRHEETNHRYAYILLVEGANTPAPAKGPGFYKDNDSEVIDLRVAVPSHFVRPHMQHGLVVRHLDHKGQTSLDFSPMTVGIIRVDLADALEWLGTGDFLNVHALFPPPTYDFGYREVLKQITTGDLLLGAINHIGA